MVVNGYSFTFQIEESSIFEYWLESVCEIILVSKFLNHVTFNEFENLQKAYQLLVHEFELILNFQIGSFNKRQVWVWAFMKILVRKQLWIWTVFKISLSSNSLWVLISFRNCLVRISQILYFFSFTNYFEVISKVIQ